MLFLKNIKPFKFGTMTYRLNSSAPFNKGSVVFPMSDNRQTFDTVLRDMMDGNKISLVSTNTVFTPLRLVERIAGITVTGVLDKKSIINRISNKFANLHNHPLTLNNQRGRNYIINSVDLLNKIRERFQIRNEDRLLAYMDYIFDKLATVPDTYDDRYIIVNVDDRTIPMSRGKFVVGDYKRGSMNLQSLFLYYIKFYPKQFIANMAKSKATVVYYGGKGVFKYSHSDLKDMVISAHAEGYSFEPRDNTKIYGECIIPSHSEAFKSLYSEAAMIREDKIIDATLIGIRKIRGIATEEEDDDVEENSVVNAILDSGINEDKTCEIPGYEENKEETVYVLSHDTHGSVDGKTDIVIGKDDKGDFTPIAATPIVITPKTESNMKSKLTSKLTNELVDDDNVSTELLNSIEELADVSIGKGIDEARVNTVYKKIKDAKLSRTRKFNGKEQRYIETLNTLMSSDEVRNIPKDIPKTNFSNVEALDDLAVNSFINFNKTYFESTFMSDVLGCFEGLSVDDSNPLYLQSYELEDTSDKLNNKKTLKVVLKDADGSKSTHKIDIPNLDGSVMYVNGNKMELQAQKIVKPIVKFGERVMITANYNKAFCLISGKYLNHNHSVIYRFVNKILDDPKLKSKVKYITFGSITNKDNIETTMEFSEISTMIKSIIIDKDNMILLDPVLREEEFGKNGLYLNPLNNEPLDSSTDNYNMDNRLIVVGRRNGAIVSIDPTMDRIHYMENGETITVKVSEYFLELLESEDKEIVDVLHSISSSVRLGFSVMRIMSRNIPIIMLLSYTDGLDTVLERAGIKYTIVIDDKKTKPTKDEILLKFQDCSLLCKVTEVEHSILLSGFQGTDLSLFSYGEFCDFNSGAAASLISELGNGNLPLYVSSFKTAFIDHITRDVLSHYDLPTDFCGVILYANNLLATDKIMHDSDTRLYRIRSAETIAATLSKVVADSFAQYSIAKKRGSKGAKLETNPNMLIRTLQEQGNVMTYSTVNPVVSADSKLKVTVKGLNGLNMDRAMSMEKRQESELSAGIIAMPSVYSGSVGIVKRMSIDPNIYSTRGYLNTPNSLAEVDEMPVKRFLSPSELITPSVSSKDEAQRAFMNLQQKGHGTGTLNPSPANYTNGYDTMIGHFAEEFCHYSKKPGVIAKMTEDFIVLDYDDGTSDVFRLKNIERHSAKAKYIDNEMHTMKGLKMGMRVKEQQPLSYNARMFVELEGVPVYCTGQLAFVAYQSGSCVYEDSTTICESLQGSMASYDFKPKIMVLNNEDIIRNAITSIGTKVKAGEPIISYISATSDSGLNELLKNNEESIDSALIKDKNASNSGEIVEINIYYTSDKVKMSNSIKNFIHKIELEYTSRGDKSIEENEKLDKFKKAYLSRIPTKVAIGTKVAGRKILDNQIIIEYVTKTYSKMGHADKVTFFDMLKGETSKILPDAMMPVGIESGIRAEAMMSPLSPINRKVQSIIVAGAVERMIFDAMEMCRKDLGLKSYLERKKK